MTTWKCQKRLKNNASKSHFCCDELEYLGYLINRRRGRPAIKMVEGIMKTDVPKSRKKARSFIGIVNYYRDMWPQRLHLLAPLSSLTLSTTKWDWTEQCQKAFEDMKR
jgi:hypothetical protein